MVSYIFVLGAVTVLHGELDPKWFASKELFPPGVYLVRGKATKVGEQELSRGSCQTSIFVIEHVYVGDNKINRQTFQVQVSRTLSGMRPRWIDDKFSIKRNERGIWWIRQDSTSNMLVADIRPTMYLERIGGFGPARDVPRDDSFDPYQFYPQCNSYKKGLFWAEKYEKLYLADAKDRVGLLKQYALGKESLLASRAIDLLAYSGMSESDYIKCLTTLTENRELSIGAQLAIDEALIRAYYRQKESLKDWYNSSRYARFVRQWLTDDLGDPETATILELKICHLLDWHDSGMEHFLDYVELLRIFITGLTNEQRSERFKKCLIQTASNFLPKDPAGRKNGFDYLTKEIQGQTNVKIQIAAARLVTAFKPLSKDQIDLVKALLKKTENQTVSHYLKDVLEESSKNKK